MAYSTYETILDATTIRQVYESSLQNNANVDKDRANGSTGPSLIALRSAGPMASWTTGDLAGLIGISGFFNSGLNIASNGMTLPLIKRSDGGVYASGSNHFAVTAASSLTIPTEIRADHDSEEGARCTCETYFRSTDGLTIPFSVSITAALASAAFNASYKMGPVVINGTQLPRCKSWRVIPGLSVDSQSFCGNTYPSELFVTGETIDPMIEITFESPEVLSSLAALFASLSSAAVYARKKSDGGVTVSDATAEHAKFSFAAGLAILGGYDAAFGRNASNSITLHGKALTAALAAVVLS